MAADPWQLEGLGTAFALITAAHELENDDCSLIESIVDELSADELVPALLMLAVAGYTLALNLAYFQDVSLHEVLKRYSTVLTGRFLDDG